MALKIISIVLGSFSSLLCSMVKHVDFALNPVFVVWCEKNVPACV